jgi:hypothetical protein
MSAYKSTPLRRHLDTLLIAFFCGFIVSCAARPIKSNEISGSFETNLKQLDLGNSFAFTRGSDELYFSRILLEEGGHKCQFFIGFKNGQFKYRFPAYRLAELAKIYDEKIPLQTKKERALQKIDGFEVEKQKCTAEIAEREKTAGERVGDVVTNILYAPLAAIGIIGMVTFGADDTVKSIKDSILEKKMDQLRLGQSTAEVKSLLGGRMSSNQTGSYYIDYGYYRQLVMVFERYRLTGMIRGSRKNSAVTK